MQIIDMLKQTPLFAELSAPELEPLLPSVRHETYPPGRVILREGRVGTAFYLLIHGQAQAIKHLDTPEEAILTTMVPGDFFGEIATIKHQPRSASVRTLTETQCLLIQRLHFDTYVQQFPSVLAKIEVALATRQHDH
jgi:CRP-like cAMP-binding protein